MVVMAGHGKMMNTGFIISIHHQVAQSSRFDYIWSVDAVIVHKRTSHDGSSVLMSYDGFNA